MTDRRIPEGARLGRVALQVGDLPRSLRFYRDLLGFRLLATGDGAARLGAQGAEGVLLELHERPGVAAGRGRLGLYHVAYLLPDRGALAAFATQLQGTGLRVGAADHLVSEAFYLDDPDGLGVEVYADRPRAAWPTREGRPLLATLPLDVGALSRAAEGRSWRGMPRGTTVGHVHLHVGDLELARAVYQGGLGLDVMAELPGALFLSAGGYHHHLGLNTWAGGGAPAAEGEARLLDWELLLPSPADVEAAARSLQGSGAQAMPSAGAWAAATTAGRQGVGRTVRDPWGIQLTLRATRPAGRLSP